MGTCARRPDRRGHYVAAPRDVCQAGLTADTPLEEAARLIMTSMGAEDAEEVAQMLAMAAFEEITLDDGMPAILGQCSAPTEAYVMTLSDRGDGLYLFTSQILRWIITTPSWRLRSWRSSTALN